MKRIIQQLRNNLNDLEAEANRSGAGKPASVHDPALQDEREAHAETKRKLELTQGELKELRLRRKPQPSIINEAPDIDHAARLNTETKKRDFEIRNLKRENESLQQQRTGLQSEIDALGIDLEQSKARFGKIGDELVGYRKAKYPVVIEGKDAEIKELKDQISEMLGTIKKQRTMIDKLSVKK